MKIMIIPEDFRKDQFILKPIFEKLFEKFGRSYARVVVCQDPLLGGVDEALKKERLSEIFDQYKGMTDMFILCVDRDGVPTRRKRLDHLEKIFREKCIFFSENAWEELETWLLAELKLPRSWSWAKVRSEISVKEKYFEKLAHLRNVENRLGGGRKKLGEEASHRIDSIRQRCPEDFDALARRIEGVL